MNCPKCALDNPPYEANCANCGMPIQNVEEAAYRRKEWNNLSSKNREEMQERYTNARKRFDNYQAWRTKHKHLHTAVGGVSVLFFMAITLGQLHWWILTAGPLFGSAAGWYLNRIAGGQFRGLGLFLGAAVLTALPFIGAAWIFGSMGFVACGGIGYYLGLRLDFSRVEHMFS